MPIDYNRRIPQVEERIERCDGILEGNKELFWDFERSLKVQDYSEARIYKLLSILKLLAERADFRFDEATREDIEGLISWVNGRDLAEASKNDYRIALKRFYRWLGDGEYPECVKWVNTTLKRSNNKLPEDLLVEKDVEKLLKATMNARDRALISVLGESGARIGEIIDLRTGSVGEHEHGMTLLIQGGPGKKTGARRLLLISSVPHIRSWLNSRPKSDEKRAPLWVNIGTKGNNKQMEYRAVLAMLYAACREVQVPRTLEEIAEASRVGKGEISRTYRLLSRELDINLPPTDPTRYVARFGSELNISGEGRVRAMDIINKAQEEKLTSGKSPSRTAAGALYIAALKCGERRTQREVAEVADVTEVTVRNRRKELVEGLGGEIEV